MVGAGWRRGCTLQGRALSTGTHALGHSNSLQVPSLALPGSLPESSHSVQTEPSRGPPASRGSPGPCVLGPLGRRGPLSAPGPAESEARTRRPLRPELGPPEAPAAWILSLAGPDSPSPSSLGTWRQARAALPGTGESNRGKTGRVDW